MKLKAAITKLVGIERIVQRKKALAELLRDINAAGALDLDLGEEVVTATVSVEDVLNIADDVRHCKSHSRGIDMKEDDARGVLAKLLGLLSQGVILEINKDAVVKEVDAWFEEKNEEQDERDEYNYRVRGIKPGCSCQNHNR